MKKKINVLHINGRSDLSGGPISMLRMIQSMDPDLFEHYISCPFSEKGIIELLADCKNCTTYMIETRKLNLFSYQKLLQIIKKNKIDIIHSHGKAAGIYSRLLQRFAKVPTIHQLHGIHYRQYNLPVQYFYFQIEKLFSSWTQKIVCVSESERNEGLSLSLFNPKKAMVIHNGVDIRLFKPDPKTKSQLRKKWNIPPGAVVLLSTLRNCYQKNLNLALEVEAEMIKKRPDTFLFLIGISPNDQEAVDRIHELGIEKNCRLIANVKNMHELLNIGDIYINTSRWEGFSLGLIEAMSMGMPVVINGEVGNLDLLRFHDRGVYVVKHPSPKDYCDALLKLSEDSDYRQFMGEQARKNMVASFDISLSMKKFEHLYLDYVKGSA